MISVYRGKTLIGDTVSPMNRALWYGEGTFTTTRILGGRALFLSRHIDRLLRTLNHFRWGEVTREDLLFATGESLQRANLDAGILRVLVSSGDGHGMMASGEADIIVSITDEVRAPRGPLTIVTAEQPPAHYSDHKLSSYMHHTHLFQSQGVRDSAIRPDEVLRVWNGHVLEGARSNVFVWTGSEIWTPPTRDILNGITRQAVCGLLPSLDIALREHELTQEDLRRARAVFLTSSLMGIGPVETIDGNPVESDPLASATMEALMRAFQEALLRDK